MGGFGAMGLITHNLICLLDLWDLIYLERVRFFTVHLTYAELKCEYVLYDTQLKL